MLENSYEILGPLFSETDFIEIRDEAVQQLKESSLLSDLQKRACILSLDDPKCEEYLRAACEKDEKNGGPRQTSVIAYELAKKVAFENFRCRI
jgi:hypothetical protein